MSVPLGRKVRVIAEVTLVCPECLHATTYGVDQAQIPESVQCSTVVGHTEDEPTVPIPCPGVFGREYLSVNGAGDTGGG